MRIEAIDHWEEIEDHKSDDWKHEVASNKTRLGYLDWVVHRQTNRPMEKGYRCPTTDKDNDYREPTIVK